jgi:enterobactin synthetase component D
MCAVVRPRVTGPDSLPVAASLSTDDLLRRLLHHASEVLNLARQHPGDFSHYGEARHPGESRDPAAAATDPTSHATRRVGDSAAIAFEQGAPDPAMLRPADLDQASHFPSAKRRYQFLLGRVAANRALALLGGAPTDAVARGPRGEPVWPAGFTGSISHTGALAIGVVLRDVRVHIGIDIESITHRDTRDLAEYVTDPAERGALACACRHDDHAFYLGFSLKEAVIKALRPPLGTSIDFRGVALLDVRAENHDDVACTWRFGDRGGTARGAVAGGVVCAVAAVAIP